MKIAALVVKVAVQVLKKFLLQSKSLADLFSFFFLAKIISSVLRHSGRE